MSWDGEQIQSLAIILRELKKAGLISELRRLADALEKQNELKEQELNLQLKNKSSNKWGFILPLNVNFSRYIIVINL